MDEQSIFFEALDLSNPEEQDAWLQEACAGDESMKRRILELLKKHQDAHSFLEQPAEGLDATFLSDVSANGRAASLEAGLATAFNQNAAVVIGNAGHSVLRSLGQTVDVPAVMLRESPTQGDGPITRPMSTELPDRDADSRYRIDGEIARGGMGAILKGRDTDLGRDLAIKVLLESHKEKPELIQRFIEEAQIGGQLQHPGIAPVYELGQFSDQRPFFSMKLVKGETLSKLLAARKEPNADRGRLLNIFEQVCQTMAYAHSRGVIHRDLKPSNIMVGAFGEVQVMDWGLAKVLPTGGVADEKTSQQKHQAKSIIQTRRSVGSDTPGSFGSAGSDTQMGSVMGTPAYMPPEQALGEIDQLDQRADVFSLGAILCEILTGQPPYVADDATQVFRMASRGKLDECLKRLDVCDADSDLIDVAIKCLEAEPIDRYDDGNELAEKITEYLESVESRLRETEIQRAADSARAVEEKKRRRTTLALATAVFLIIGMIGAFWINQRQAAIAIVENAFDDARSLERQAYADNSDAGDEGKLSLLEDSLQIYQGVLEEDADARLKRRAEVAKDDLTEKIKLLKRQIKTQAFAKNLDSLWNDAIGSDDFSLEEIGFDWVSIAHKYENVFRENELDLSEITEKDAVSQIKDSAIKEVLISALDSWSVVLKKISQQIDDAVVAADNPARSSFNTSTSAEQLVKIANEVDANEERIKVRNLLLVSDIEDLAELAIDSHSDRLKTLSQELFVWLGSELLDKKEKELAFKVLNEGVSRFPGDFLLNMELAQTYNLERNPEKAVEYARAALAIRPDSTSACMYLVASLTQSGRSDEGLMVTHAALERNVQSKALMLSCVNAYSAAGDHDQAIQLADELINLFRGGELTERIIVRGMKSQALENVGDMAGALSELEIALALENDRTPEVNVSNIFAFMYLRKGQLKVKQGKLPEAKKAFEESIARKPDMIQGYTELSWLQLDLGNVQDSIITLNEAIDHDERGDPYLLYTLAFLYAANRDFESAKKRIGNLPTSTDPQAIQLKAWALAAFRPSISKMDDYGDCLKWAEEAVELNEKLGKPIYSHLNTYGVVLYRSNKWKEAIDALERSEHQFELDVQVSQREFFDKDHLCNLLFIAMAKHQLHLPDARGYYDDALGYRKKFGWSKDPFLVEALNEAKALFEDKE